MEIQGSAADLIKLAMLHIHQRLRREGLRSRMLMQIHDELVFEAPPGELKQLAALVKEEMTTPLEKELALRTPLKVELAAGPNWLDVEEVTRKRGRGEAEKRSRGDMRRGRDDCRSGVPLFPSSPLPLVVGLVGGIGAGKSQVAEAFARRGARVISGDALAHAALREPAIKKLVVERWGDRLLDDKGEIQRRLLAEVVFADAGERRALEAMVHPWIKERIRAEVEAARADANGAADRAGRGRHVGGRLARRL